ncbi:MAG TPA: PIG-L family deacetylase [Candidatus Saccharimonadales bacterium]|nr:PIG-L family deacetylase [Candidatus Saccharimonadales bacterium]
MKKVLFGIFAHPDDEAFGPGGTLIKAVHDGVELHLITLTLGQNGTNPDNAPDLGTVRREEWLKSGQMIGATSQHELGYIDGRLCNIEMLEITEKIQHIVRETIADRDIEVEFIGFDLNGLTGHIDHIVASRALCLAFYRLKQDDSRFTRIRLFCLPREQNQSVNTNWIYMEAGRTPEEIDETIDARKYYKKIIDVMRTHHSQRSDAETQIDTLGHGIGINHFIILS